MQLISILACSNNGIIGINNLKNKDYTIPWKIPSDMMHFKNITKNNILIMGSKTYESLPKVFFKNNSRSIIVLTRKKKLIPKNDYIFIANSKDQALDQANKLINDSYNNHNKNVIVCGGKEIYSLFKYDVNKWIVSHINSYISKDKYNNYEIVNVLDILDYIQNNNIKATIIQNPNISEKDEYSFEIIEYYMFKSCE